MRFVRQEYQGRDVIDVEIDADAIEVVFDDETRIRIMDPGRGEPNMLKLHETMGQRLIIIPCVGNQILVKSENLNA